MKTSKIVDFSKAFNASQQAKKQNRDGQNLDDMSKGKLYRLRSQLVMELIKDPSNASKRSLIENVNIELGLRDQSARKVA